MTGSADTAGVGSETVRPLIGHVLSSLSLQTFLTTLEITFI